MHYDYTAIEKMLLIAKTHEHSVMRHMFKPEYYQHIIKETAKTVVELRHVLAQYPHVKYEPLDFLYFTIDCINALDEELAIDLATCTDSSGITFFCWLHQVRPTPFQAELLSEIEYALLRHPWLIKMSLEPTEDIASDLKIIQNALQPFCNKPRYLPLAGDVEKALQLQAYVKQLYAKEGSNGVIAYLKQNKQ